MEEAKVFSAFLSGLPYEIKEDDIKAFLSEIGHIK